MPFVSVTRLRVRSIRFLPRFFWHTRLTLRQVERSPGFIGGSLLPERGWVFWTLTVWESEPMMRAYMTSGDHRAVMPRLFGWCDEASVVHWQTADRAVPAWPVAVARMRGEGRPSKLRHPGADHQAMRFAPPRSFTGSAIRPR